MRKLGLFGIMLNFWDPPLATVTVPEGEIFPPDPADAVIA
jgi:hypothetical protein